MTAPQAPSATPHASDAASRYQPRAIEGDLRGRHIVSVEQFARPDLDALCRTAAELRRRTRSGDTSVLRLARRKIMASVFYEASTRTDMSFQAAMLRMGGEVIATSGGVQFSSVYKGENLADTVRAIGCYADVLVLRHPEVGSSYEAALHLDQLAARLGTRCVVISGGDGIGEHPSQALLDLFTIVDRLGDTDGLRITFVGDLANGRTVHSLAKLIALYGARGGASRLRLARRAADSGCDPRVRRGTRAGHHDERDVRSRRRHRRHRRHLLDARPGGALRRSRPSTTPSPTATS